MAVFKALWVYFGNDLADEVVEGLTVILLNSEERSEHILTKHEQPILTKDLIGFTHLRIATTLLAENASK